MSHKHNPWSGGTLIVAERSLAVWEAEWKINIRPDFKLTGLTRTFMLTLLQKFKHQNKQFCSQLGVQHNTNAFKQGSVMIVRNC